MSELLDTGTQETNMETCSLPDDSDRKVVYYLLCILDKFFYSYSSSFFLVLDLTPE